MTPITITMTPVTVTTTAATTSAALTTAVTFHLKNGRCFMQTFEGSKGKEAASLSIFILKNQNYVFLLKHCSNLIEISTYPDIHFSEKPAIIGKAGVSEFLLKTK